MDEQYWRTVEPGTPSPPRRLAAVRTLTESGLGCGVLMAPILPYLTDAPARLRATVEAIAAAGARSVTPLVLHLRPGAREWYLQWLAQNHPDLVARYRTLYRGGSYAAKAYQRKITAQVNEYAREFGLGRRAGRLPGEASAGEGVEAHERMVTRGAYAGRPVERSPEVGHEQLRLI